MHSLVRSRNGTYKTMTVRDNNDERQIRRSNQLVRVNWRLGRL